MSYSIKAGVKTFPIEVEDVENGVINLRFNPADQNLLIRYNKFSEMLDKKLDELPKDDIALDENGMPKAKEVAERIEQIGDIVCESYDEIFGAGTSDELFKYCHPMTIRDGEPFAVSIGRVISQIIKDNGEKERPKYERYLKKYQR